MNKNINTIRPISLLLVKDEKGRMLVFKAKDGLKGEEFYRFLGGGIKFGEKSDEALKREIKEEIGAEIYNLKLITVLENIFDYEGLGMHELAFIYRAEFVDKNFYDFDNMDINDSKKGRQAIWLDRDHLMQCHFYPEGIKDHI